MNSLKKIQPYQNAEMLFAKLREFLSGLATIHELLDQNNSLQMQLSTELQSLLEHSQKDIAESRLSLLSYIVAQCLKDTNQNQGTFRFRGQDCIWTLSLDTFSEQASLNLSLQSEFSRLARA